MCEETKSYIFLQTALADNYPDKSRNRTFRLGDIVHHVDDMNDFLVLVEGIENFAEKDENYWLVRKQTLRPFDISFEEYLLPVKPLKDRIKLLENVELCQWLKDLRKRDFVRVVSEALTCYGHANLKGDKTALVKYKGPIPEIESAGILFGVEILKPEDGDVNIDCVGHSGYKDYFFCQPYSGLILTANQIDIVHNVSRSIPKESKENFQLPFKVANSVVNQRAKFESMPHSSYFPSRSVDHSDHIGRLNHSFDMDKTFPQSSRPDKLAISKKSSECRNGCATSPFNNDQRCVSSDQIYKKDKKVENSFSELPISHSSSNFTQSGRTTSVNKANGAASQRNSIQGDTIDGCKVRNIPRPVINHCVDTQYSTTYRDDYSTHKLCKVPNTVVSNNQQSPGYISTLHSVHSDPDLNRLPNDRDHNLHYRDADFASSPGSSSEFEIGSLVEVDYNGKPRYGVIRWMGEIPEKSKKISVGIETETELEPETRATDGNFGGVQYFTCHRRRGIFVNLSKCKKDRRFQEDSSTTDAVSKTFGYADCPKIEGRVRPQIVHSRDLHKIYGKPKGIQGHHNSCYLDATLFSMFTFTSVFDSLLYRPCEPKDTPQYNEVQSVLRDEIVNPLRKNMFVRADKVMKLRTLLEKHSSVSGLTSEEKDPEEFLNSLVAQMLRAEPFLKLSSGQEAYYYQLFVEKNERLEFPTVQNLFEESFLASDIKLQEVPSCLIIQMPRFGKSFKMYPRILPSQLLDVTDVIEDSPRQCYYCGKLANFECKACMKKDLETMSYCEGCLDRAHRHPECRNKRHECKELPIPYLFEEFPYSSISRVYMELFAVVCIETSHYVTFVKCGDGPDAPWCFFDSMADRSGEQNGFNIPEVIAVPDLPLWLTDDGKHLQQVKDKELPEHAKRLLCDAYMCMYRSPEMQMYR